MSTKYKNIIYILIFTIISISIVYISLSSEEKTDLKYLITRNKEPRIVVTSASIFPNDRCDIWIKNRGKSQAVDLNYYIIDEKTGEYNPLGIGQNYSIRSGSYFMVSTFVNQTGQIIEQRSFRISYSWIKNGVLVSEEKEIVYMAIFDITRKN